MKIYLLSGLGGDNRIFKNLKFPEGYEAEFIPWQKVETEETLSSYVKKLAEPINTSEPFILFGVSFGGICAQEMCNFLNPKKLILISTLTSAKELPGQLRAGGSFQEIIPSQLYRWVAINSAPVVGIYRVEGIKDFREMVKQYDADYFKWAIKSVGEWEGVELQLPILRLHGSKDKVFPSKNIQGAELVKGGEHIMVMQEGREISERIREFLKD